MRWSWNGNGGAAGLATAAAETAANRECHVSASSDRRLWQRGRGPTGETAVLLDANNQAGFEPSRQANFFIEANTGAATGSLHGFQNLSDENLKDEPAPRPAAIARGGIRRIEPVKKGGAAIQIVMCIRVSHVSKKKTTPSSTLHSRLSLNRASEHNLVALLDK
eukprot:s2509_g8.t1